MTSRSVVASLPFVLAVAAAACDTPPEPLPPDAPLITVCEAARAGIGSRIRVRGEFNGTDYAVQPTTITLSSDDICTSRGGGSIFAKVFDRSEMSKIATAAPRSERPPQKPGTVITIEGTITKIDDGRFVHLDGAIVR